MSDKLLQTISALVKTRQRLAHRAERLCAPEVDAIINEKCIDRRQIERLLDRLLDFAFESNVLCLYKKLCRYYFRIDSDATASYVYAYRDMWGADSNETTTYQSRLTVIRPRAAAKLLARNAKKGGKR